LFGDTVSCSIERAASIEKSIDEPTHSLVARIIKPSTEVAMLQ